MRRTRTAVALSAAFGILGIAGVAMAASGFSVVAGNDSGARLDCPGGMSRLGQPFSVNASVFPGDPAPSITIVANIPDNGYLVEEVKTGTHTGTHLDSPGHFIDGGRTVDDLAATEFVWPAYVIDVRRRMAREADDGFQVSVADIQSYENRNGRIPRGAMVIIRTGFDQPYGTPAFNDPAPGFAGPAVQWMVDNRRIGGVGSDTFGPDATRSSTQPTRFSQTTGSRYRV